MKETPIREGRELYDPLNRVGIGRQKSCDNIQSDKSYRRFKKAHPSSKLTKREMGEIMNACTEEYIGAILDGNLVKLPYGLGKMGISKNCVMNRIFKHARKYSIIDWKESFKVKKRIFRTFDETDGYMYKFFWTKYKANFFMSSVWEFNVIKALKKRLKEKLLDPTTNFNEIYRPYTFHYTKYVSRIVLKKKKWTTWVN